MSRITNKIKYSINNRKYKKNIRMGYHRLNRILHCVNPVLFYIRMKLEADLLGLKILPPTKYLKRKANKFDGSFDYYVAMS